MTPEEKAKSLIDKFYRMGDIYPQTTYAHAKQSAIIRVDEMLKELPSQIHEYNNEVELEIIYNNIRYQFWHETKQAIQNA